MPAKEDVTFGIAIVGATLGVVNFWRALDRDRTKLKVIPKLYKSTGGESGFSVEIINLSLFTISVAEVGFFLKNGERLVGLESFGTNKILPERLESRAAFTFYFAPGTDQDKRATEIRHAYAWTSCDRVFAGNSKALKSRVNALRASGQT